jgi:Helicase conserved C-terminal domain
VLSKPEARSRVYGTLVAALLDGPLAWLSLVDVAAGRDGPRAFRVRPSASVLVGRPVLQPPTPATVIVSDDASVLVPAGTADTAVHSLLTRVGEFVGGSAEGLRYILTAERVQTAFDDGLSGPELLRCLEERSPKPVPRRVRSRIERWWASYGRVRLYDELSLVELSKEILPAEVLAAVPALRRHLVYAISPRLLAVEPTAAEGVVAELVRLGYAPRILEGGAGA